MHANYKVGENLNEYNCKQIVFTKRTIVITQHPYCDNDVKTATELNNYLKYKLLNIKKLVLKDFKSKIDLIHFSDSVDELILINCSVQFKNLSKNINKLKLLSVCNIYSNYGLANLRNPSVIYNTKAYINNIPENIIHLSIEYGYGCNFNTLHQKLKYLAISGGGFTKKLAYSVNYLPGSLNKIILNNFNKSIYNLQTHVQLLHIDNNFKKSINKLPYFLTNLKLYSLYKKTNFNKLPKFIKKIIIACPHSSEKIYGDNTRKLKINNNVVFSQ